MTKHLEYQPIAAAADHALPLGPLPEFPGAVPHRTEPCSPRELYDATFVELEENVHYLEPAFHFASHALQVVEAADDAGLTPNLDSNARLADHLIGGARAELAAQPLAHALDAVRGWPALVAREFAPTGLADGAWLRGSVLANRVETPLGMTALRQLMLRFGDPASREPYSLRYASLLQSLGVPPESITRAALGEAPAELSFEHALLGVCLGLFASTFGPELAGFNLWMAVIGPCPLLEGLLPALRGSGACLRYFERLDREALASLARQALSDLETESSEDPLVTRRRVTRGFLAAQRSYLRWQRALLARAERELPGGARPLDRGAEPAPEAPLAGRYTAPHELEALRAWSYGRYGALSHNDLYFCFANSDLHPGAALFARAFVEAVLHKLEHVLHSDPRLDSQNPPPYSEAGVAELVARQHDKNVQSRVPRHVSEAEIEPGGDGKPEIVQVFDGSWLQGFADVGRAGFEEYGWLFRIYASEHGDGDLAWNHCQIFRKAFADAGPAVALPKTDRRLYDVFEIGAAAVVTLAVALNTRCFMPEVLGINLGIEATGVGGMYMDQWKGALQNGSPWRALAWRLHNSIDNYADGHTKWSLAAVQAFMQRVKAGSPQSVERQWQRVWRLWRCQDILTHGNDAERGALAEHLRLKSMATT